MGGDNEETVIAPGKTETAAQNKPQQQKSIHKLKSTAQVLFLRTASASFVPAGSSPALRCTQAAQSSC